MSDLRRRAAWWLMRVLAFEVHLIAAAVAGSLLTLAVIAPLGLACGYALGALDLSSYTGTATVVLSMGTIALWIPVSLKTYRYLERRSVLTTRLLVKTGMPPSERA